MEAISGSAGAARNSHQLEGGPSSDRHVEKLFVTFIDREGGELTRLSETGGGCKVLAQLSEALLTCDRDSFVHEPKILDFFVQII